MINADEIAKRSRAMKGKPAAIEAYWDGDTEGWCAVMICAVSAPTRAVHAGGLTPVVRRARSMVVQTASPAPALHPGLL